MHESISRRGGRAVVDKETEALVKKDGIQLLQLKTSLSFLREEFSSLTNERQKSDYLERVNEMCVKVGIIRELCGMKKVKDIGYIRLRIKRNYSSILREFKDFWCEYQLLLKDHKDIFSFGR